MHTLRKKVVTFAVDVPRRKKTHHLSQLDGIYPRQPCELFHVKSVRLVEEQVGDLGTDGYLHTDRLDVLRCCVNKDR